MRNRPPSDNEVLSRVVDQLISRLPGAWRAKLMSGRGKGARRPDALLNLRAPGEETATLVVEAKRRLDPKDVPRLVDQLRAYGGDAAIVVAPFLGTRTRERLRDAGVGYLDLAGNIRVALDQPALFIESNRVERNPWREERPARSLKGAKAGRIVRLLCDFLPPVGVRELAGKAKTNPGYVSRILDLLEREDDIKRKPRGPVTDVEWPALIRRWAQDYSLLESNRTKSYLNPRGLSNFLDGLRKAKLKYAVTGSVASARVAPVAAARLAVCYVDDLDVSAQRLKLRTAEVGANVILAQPFDPVVYERTWERDGITFCAMSQIAADLLTGPGRSPVEADELMAWMAKNESAWRA